MRRPDPFSLPEFLRSDTKPPAPGEPNVAQRPRASFDLRTITPVIGGGVVAGTPDEIDLVRIPGIRGQLRQWWRWLYAADRQAEELFRAERAIWGGLGSDARDRKEPGSPDATRSRVKLKVEILEPGEILPAGIHEMSGGRPRALPRWKLGAKLGYALFPLQLSNKERGASPPTKGGLPTRSVRQQLRFRLHLIWREQPGEDDERCEQVLASVWAWSCFGGLGARTRRGFGALALDGFMTQGLPEGIEKRWRSIRRAPHVSEARSWIDEFFNLAGAQPGVFRGATFLVGEPKREASEAHGELVDLLKRFRQGVGTGRADSRGRPGKSYWPEPKLLRRLRTGPADDLGVPRAAFGLPIQFSFKRPDQSANALVVPGQEKLRHASPLLLRPLRDADGRHLPLVVILKPNTLPDTVEIRRDGGNRESAQVLSAGGTEGPIRKLLETHGGDALKAFAAWLSQQHRFKTLFKEGSELA